MTKKILVAFDGSDHADRTLRRAAELAVAENAEMIILHAVVPHHLSDEEIAYAEERCGNEYRERMRHASRVRLPLEDMAEERPVRQYIEARDIFYRVLGEDILKRAETRAKELGVRTVKTELEFEHPAKAILDAARRKDVDMIVMGRKGHNRIVEFFLGSTAQHVIQHAERSVLMVA